ncbi:DUF1516 family protein [Metabacillus mangrovi]|nr:DUF1516 family protein [Metabacillus mangrovi]
MTHWHIAAWILAVILFFAVYVLYKKGRMKSAAVLHGILRLDYLLVLASGFYLVASVSITFGHLMKAALGILTIGFLEIVAVHKKKGESYKPLWIFCLAVLGGTILLGLYLPLGIRF